MALDAMATMARLLLKVGIVGKRGAATALDTILFLVIARELTVFLVYTDGSGTTSGPGGIAYVALDESGAFVQEESLPLREATNQKAEILAAAYALHRLPEGSEIRVVSDSSYLVKGFHEWLPKWLENGWRKSSGGRAKNQAHWQRLHDAAQRHIAVDFEWCEGHAGIEWNERADVLAGQARAVAKAQAAAALD